ncbi:MAG TPA: DUF4214 domain-containing protein [Pyrinomonadaceae bacterium]|nr:DUF4214 domain-containing protein [Pyrinomonadaceae bacterium]
MKFRYPDSIRTILIASIVTVIVATLFIRTRTSTAAADGDLDATFGSGGKVVTDFFGRTNGANAIAMRSDGKIVVTGDAASAQGPGDISVARYNSDGSLDTTFGTGGRVTTDFAGRSDSGAAITVQPDGKILAAGGADLAATQFDFALVRYNLDGSLDSTFGTGGKVTTDFNGGLDAADAIALQTDGKIVLAGFATAGDPHMALARYNSNGTLDTTFGTGGKLITNINGTRDFANALAIQSDGKILAGGSTLDSITSFVIFALARYNADGSLDTTFGSGGKVTTQVVFGDGEDDEIFGLAIQPDGRILAAGRANFAQDFGMVRYQTNGSVDTSFGTSGVVTTDFNGHIDRATGIALQVDGKIVLAGAANLTTGSTGDFGLARYNPSGALDSTFGAGGKVITDFGGNVDIARGVVIQSDNRIVAAGSTINGPGTGDFALARYLATAQPSDVGGRILDTNGKPVEGVAIRMTGTQNRLTITDSQGNYRFDNVTINGNYTVTPSRANFSFSPVSRSFVHPGSHTDASFTATFTAAGLNPLDTSEYFVRQHYVDFLSREPDESGFNFWVNQIESCGADANCREVRRINVSAAFFLSIEFQQTGYLVYRTYKTAYGNISGTPVPVRFAEFLPDTQQIGQGVIVGQTGWEATLENNKRTFMEAFVRRSRFATAFPPGTSAGQYVDTLNTNAGGVLTPTERDQLVSDLIAETKTAGQVLRVVAEDQDLVNSEFNKAFVLMEYFGYLRRNPNDPPEQTLDFQGYNFWLGKLNQFNGNFVNAEMVKAFLTSSEYRGRFPR